MSFLGSLFGYDSRGRDLLGVNRQPDYNCMACGIDCMSHSPEKTNECLRKIWKRPGAPDKEKP